MEMVTMPIAIAEAVPRVIVRRIIDPDLVVGLVNVSTFVAMPSVVVSLIFVSRTQNDSRLAELVPQSLLGRTWEKMMAMTASTVQGISRVMISCRRELLVVMNR
jgi:hypothetical protein